MVWRERTFGAGLAGLSFLNNKEVLANGNGILLIRKELYDLSGLGGVDLDVDLCTKPVFNSLFTSEWVRTEHAPCRSR